MANTRDRVTGAVTDIRPYVERALTDEKVRQDVQSALSSARSVFNELVGGRGVTYVAGRVASDKEIQENLRGAIDDLRRAADRVQGKDTHKGRNTFFLLTGVALGLLFNPVTGPGTRRWLSETFFGGSEEDYTFPQPTDSNMTPPAA